jgi:glucose/arabinose dehydrogenase
MWLKAALGLTLLSAVLVATPTFGPGVDSSQFNVTLFTSGLAFPQSMQQLTDGSIVVQTSPGFSGGSVLRFVDSNNDGVADFSTGLIYGAPAGQGPLTQMVQAGNYFIQGNYGSHSIVILQKGATPDATLTEVGRFDFGFAPDWWHDSEGIAVRPTPGQPGSFDLVFNVGSQFDAAASVNTVAMSNLMNATLNADSLYMVTLNLNGSTPVASNLRQVAHGIRNVFGMAFAPNGDLWFSDNSMDGDPFPPQAEELNRISAADLGVNVIEFGFPTCYSDYFTGVTVNPGCTDPVQAFIPLNGMYSQGATQIAFAPEGFPAPFNHGIFIAFAGNPPGERNPLIFYNLDTGEYRHFLLGGTGSLRQTGLLATQNSLFVSDFLTGEVFQITAVSTPEPAAFLLTGAGLLIVFLKRARSV